MHLRVPRSGLREQKVLNRGTIRTINCWRQAGQVAGAKVQSQGGHWALHLGSNWGSFGLRKYLLG